MDRPEEALGGRACRATSVEVGREEQVRAPQRQLRLRVTPDLAAMQQRQPREVGAGDIAEGTVGHRSSTPRSLP